MTPNPHDRFTSTAGRQIRSGWVPMSLAVVISLARNGNGAATVLLIAAVAVLTWLLRGST